MNSLEALSLSTYVRFGLTGLVTLMLFAVVPTLIYVPQAFAAFNNVGGVVGITILSLALGFIVDGLKLYQFKVGYKARRTAFMGDIAVALDVERRLAPVYFVKLAQLERQRGLGYADLLHAKWVMLQVCSRLFIGACLLGGAAALLEWRFGSASRAIALATVALTSGLIGWRLVITAKQEQALVEKTYVEFCRCHRLRVLAPDLGGEGANLL